MMWQDPEPIRSVNALGLSDDSLPHRYDLRAWLPEGVTGVILNFIATSASAVIISNNKVNLQIPFGHVTSPQVSSQTIIFETDSERFISITNTGTKECYVVGWADGDTIEWLPEYHNILSPGTVWTDYPLSEAAEAGGLAALGFVMNRSTTTPFLAGLTPTASGLGIDDVVARGIVAVTAKLDSENEFEYKAENATDPSFLITALFKDGTWESQPEVSGNDILPGSAATWETYDVGSHAYVFMDARITTGTILFGASRPDKTGSGNTNYSELVGPVPHSLIIAPTDNAATPKVSAKVSDIANSHLQRRGIVSADIEQHSAQLVAVDNTQLKLVISGISPSANSTLEIEYDDAADFVSPVETVSDPLTEPATGSSLETAEVAFLEQSETQDSGNEQWEPGEFVNIEVQQETPTVARLRSRVLATDELTWRLDLEVGANNFSLPTDATILGIELKIWGDRTSGGSDVREFNVQLLKNAVPSGDNKADTGTNWSGTDDTLHSYGGATDLWGTTWTASDVNDVDFGAAFQFKCHDDGGGSPRIRLDYASIKVYYSLAQLKKPGSEYTHEFTETVTSNTKRWARYKFEDNYYHDGSWTTVVGYSNTLIDFQVGSELKDDGGNTLTNVYIVAFRESELTQFTDIEEGVRGSIASIGRYVTSYPVTLEAPGGESTDKLVFYYYDSASDKIGKCWTNLDPTQLT